MNKTNISLLVSSVLFIVWIGTVFGVRSTFLNSVSSDPLAMIHSLYPFFWFVLSAYLLLCVAIVYMRINRVSIHVLVLAQLSLVLYFTPFALSGFSWNPDSLWLSAVAKYIPDVLSGEEVMFSVYAETYPFSFILSHCVTEVTGIDVFAFAKLYPLFSIIALTLLGYVLASRFLSRRAAFISMLFVLPGWHYVDFHACPHLTGLLLLFTIMILLTRYEGKSLAIVFLLMLSLILSHPVSPLTLIVFCLTIYFCLTAMRRIFSRRTEVVHWIIARPRSVNVLVLTLGIGWVSWLFYAVFPISQSIVYAVRRALTLDFGEMILGKAAAFTVGGGSFIYPEIFDLTRLTYISYIVIAGVLMLYDLAVFRFGKKRKVNVFSLERIISFFSSFSFVAFSYLLLLGTGDHHLLYRGQILFVLMISIFIASHLLTRRQTKKITALFFFSWLIFLLSVFPIVSYSISAYNSFLDSEGIGVIFIADNVYLSGKTVSMGADKQVSPYVDLSDFFDVVDFPPNLTRTHPEIVVLRKSSFYVIAMRYDISFEHNRFVELRDQLEETIEYNKIYSNPTTETYVLNQRPS